MKRVARSTRSLPYASLFPDPQPAAASLLLRFRTMTTETEAGAASTGAVGARSIKLTDPGSHRDMRRTFYIDAVVDKVMNKSLGHPFVMWTKTRVEWYRLLKTEQGCRLLLKSRFLNQLRASIRDDELDATKKFGADKVCLGRSFAEHTRMKRNLYHYKYISLANEARVQRDATTPPRYSVQKDEDFSLFSGEDSVRSVEEQREELATNDQGLDAKDENADPEGQLNLDNGGKDMPKE